MLKMDPTISAAVIGAVATIVGAVLGGALMQSSVLDRLFSSSHFTQLVGKWDSIWTDLKDPQKKVFKELFVVTRQKGSRVFGYIIVEGKADKRWEFEGNFSGRFLQLYYHPSPEADDKLFLDYGCYFFDLQGDGTFKGYSVGFDHEENAIDVSEHRLKKIR
jgi:hypothetical protein